MSTRNLQNERQEVKGRLAELLGFNRNELLRNDLGTELNFESLNDIYDGVFALFEKIDKVRLDNLPKIKLYEIRDRVNEMIEIFGKIKLFSIAKQPNPLNFRDQFIQQLESYFNSALNTLMPIVAYLKSFEESTQDADRRNSIEELNLIIKNVKDNSIRAEKEILSILESARQTGTKVGIASYSSFFEKEAAENRSAANKWLIFLIISVVITVAWGIACFYIKPKNETNPAILQFTLAKLIVISGLYYCLTILTKNYKAHQHNYVVNRHKQNSLNSFEAFVKGAGDDLDTKNAILLSATQSIFSAQPSGYSSIDPDTEQPKIIEILKSTQSSNRTT